MPPQPLSNFRSTRGINIHPIALTRHPDLALLVMQVIQEWAGIDSHMNKLCARFLKTDFLVVSAMFQALTGAEGRRTAMEAAARFALSEDDFALYQAVMKAIKPSRVRRNEFVHHLWGDTISPKNALLLIDPKHLNQSYAILEDHAARFKLSDAERFHQRPALPLEDLSKYFVYQKPALEETLNDSKRAAGNVTYLDVALIPEHSKADEARKRLLRQPVIQQSLQHSSN